MSNYGGNVTFFSGNPYLPANAQAQLTSGESFNAYIFPRDLDLMSNEEPRTNAYSIVAGLKGDLDSYTWNLSYTHGESRFENLLTNNINLENYFAAADVVPGLNGPECYVSTTQYASLYPGCTPLDLFGEGNESKAALAYIQQNTEWWVDNGMNDVVASITGSPVNDWAGPVSLAFDTEYRTQSLNETTDSPPLAKPSFTGLRDLPFPNPTTVYAFGTTGASRGSDSVWEMGGETVVPLVRDLPLVKSLDLSGAARYTDYSTSGEATTWKAGLEYKPVEQLTIRATESRDIRAPTLYDLYAGQGSTVDFLFDPVTFIGKVVHPITEGNPNLVPEVAKTTTAGIVYAPSWLEGLQMSADFYSIILKNAITPLSGADINILSECAQNPNTALCNQLIVRGNGPNSFPTAVYEISYNVARNWTRGVDVDASYSAPLYQWSSRLRGDLNLRLLYSYQPVNDIVNQPGAAVENIADIYGSSYQRATIMVGYNLGSIGLNWQTRWRSAEARDYAGVAYAVGPIPAYAVSDVNLEYRFTRDTHELSAFLNVQNVFNIQPTVAPSGPQIPGFWNPAAVGEDVVGRYFTVGVKFDY
jgi:iron complex outermembrane receptor protein